MNTRKLHAGGEFPALPARDSNAEILSRISDRMLGCVEAARAEHAEPAEQLVAAVLATCE